MTAETASPLSTEDLLERAERWLQHDPDPNARAQLRKILDQARSTQPSNEAQAAAIAELADRFSGPLVFGTAGLRGVIGAVESRMNRAVVILTTAGLAAFLSEALGDEARRASRRTSFRASARRRSPPSPSGTSGPRPARW